MAKARKDDKGRVLRKGEVFRRKSALYWMNNKVSFR